MATATGLATTIERGAWPALGPKLGMVSVEIDFSKLTAAEQADGESVQAIVFGSPVLVLAAGIEVMKEETNAATLDLGTAEDAVEFVSAQSAQTAGQMAMVGPAAPVYIAKDGGLVVSIDTAAVTDGIIRVWALVVDIAEM